MLGALCRLRGGDKQIAGRLNVSISKSVLLQNSQFMQVICNISDRHEINICPRKKCYQQKQEEKDP